MAASPLARRQLTRIRTAGLVDSAGLALGWTVFTLYAVAVQGLGAVALYHAAMYVGVAAAAPFAGLVSRRWTGATLLRGLSACEAVLRVSSFVLLVAGAPVALVAALVLLQNVIAWSNYAVMRAEIAAVDPSAANMTWYGVVIGATEALAAAAAAFVPEVGAAVSTPTLVAVMALYAGSLVPTWRVARHARTRPTAPAASRGAVRSLPWPALVGGATVVAVAAGPTLLAVPLAHELAGRQGVVVAALAFTAGCLVAPTTARLTESRHPGRSLTLLGGLMVAGWALAPLHVAGLALAQVLSGVGFTAFEGSMDARILSRTDEGTAHLAYAASARALGGAGAVALLPLLMALAPLGYVAAALGGGLLLVAGAWSLTPRGGVDRHVVPPLLAGPEREAA